MSSTNWNYNANTRQLGHQQSRDSTPYTPHRVTPSRVRVGPVAPADLHFVEQVRSPSSTSKSLQTKKCRIDNNNMPQVVIFTNIHYWVNSPALTVDISSPLLVSGVPQFRQVNILVPPGCSMKIRPIFTLAHWLLATQTVKRHLTLYVTSSDAPHPMHTAMPPFCRGAVQNPPAGSRAIIALPFLAEKKDASSVMCTNSRWLGLEANHLRSTLQTKTTEIRTAIPRWMKSF